MRRPEHKRFIGDQAVCAGLLPAARKLAKRLRSRLILSPLAVLTDWIKGGGAIALVRVSSHEDHITIWADGGFVEYEMWTSEAIDNNVIGTPPWLDGLAVYVAGKGSTHQLGKQKKSTPLVALCDDCTVPLRDPPIPIFPTDQQVAGDAYMRTPFYWQNQKLPEFVWWPGHDGRTFVTSAIGAAPGYISVGRIGRASSRFKNARNQYIEDFNWDLRPSIYSAQEKSSAHIATGAPDLDAPNWWRRAFTRVVDGVTIVCMTDARGGWHFWPAGDYGIYVPSELVVSVRPAYPLWCHDFSLGLWEFNSNGTRAVCCPTERIQSELTKSGDVVYKHVAEGWTNIDPADYPGFAELAMEDSPGLIEVQIDLTLDVNGQPVPVVSVIRQQKFSDTGKYVFYAAYLAPGAHPNYATDTLVTARFDLRILNGNLFEHTDPGQAPFYYPDNTHTTAMSSMVIDVVSGEDAIELYRVLMHGETGHRFKEELGGTVYPDGSSILGILASFSLDSVRLKYIGRIVGLNLPTLSWAVQHQYGAPGVLAASAAVSVVAYGEEVFYDHTGPVPREDWPTWDVMDTGNYQVPPFEALGYWASLLKEAAPMSPFDEFCWHPKGHWSVTLAAYPNPTLVPAFYDRVLDTDIVCYRRNDAPVYTTHKALYNAAFDDNRDYDWYHNNPDGYRGTFRTAGVWRAW